MPKHYSSDCSQNWYCNYQIRENLIRLTPVRTTSTPNASHSNRVLKYRKSSGSSGNNQKRQNSHMKQVLAAPCFFMGRPTVRTVFQDFAGYYSSWPWCPRPMPLMEEVPGKLVGCSAKLSAFDFEDLHWGCLKHQAAANLSCLPTARIDSFSLEELVLVQMIIKA